MLLLLSHFSCVWLCATSETAAHQAPPSLGFSSQEHWSGLPFPSPMHESEKWKWSRSVCLTLCNPVDCSPPGPFIHGVLQARIPEWVAIPLFRGYSQPRDWTQVCCIAGRFFTIWATREALVGAGWGSWCDCILVSSTYFDFFFFFLVCIAQPPFQFFQRKLLHK